MDSTSWILHVVCWIFGRWIFTARERHNYALCMFEVECCCLYAEFTTSLKQKTICSNLCFRHEMLASLLQLMGLSHVRKLQDTAFSALSMQADISVCIPGSPPCSCSHSSLAVTHSIQRISKQLCWLVVPHDLGARMVFPDYNKECPGQADHHIGHTVIVMQVPSDHPSFHSEIQFNILFETMCAFVLRNNPF